MIDVENQEKFIRQKFEGIRYVLNERSLRCWSAAEAKALGRGGISLVCRATGISRPTIYKGLAELSQEDKLDFNRIRAPGGGRKKLTEQHPELSGVLDKLIDPFTRGDPESPLRWTSKSTAKLAEELNRRGYKIDQKTVYNMLSENDYSMQSNRKGIEGSSHPDRDAQFCFINKEAKKCHDAGYPVLSVDTKKKENLGNYKNGGREWRPKKTPIKVNTHDFPNKELGKVAPYGIYDLESNKGWLSLGISHDTAEFAVASLRDWWKEVGQLRYKQSESIMITADCGGSNGYRVRLWKYELQKLANELNRNIVVRHFPPGTSKWNKIEHRMFSYITHNWRGQPLVDMQTVVNLISNTTTKKGLEIKVKVDEREYKKGRKISDKEFSEINIEREEFHGDWNYTIKPNNET